MTDTIVQGGAGITPTKMNEIVVGTTAPASPFNGQLWIDTSVTGAPVMKIYNGAAAAWRLVGDTGITSGSQGADPRLLYEDATTSTNNTNVDNATLKAITSISVASTQTVLARFTISGGVAASAYGLNINGTVVNHTTSAPLYSGTNGVFASGAGSGAATIDIVIGKFGHWGRPNTLNPLCATAAMPAAPWTSITLLTKSGVTTISCTAAQLWQIGGYV